MKTVIFLFPNLTSPLRKSNQTKMDLFRTPRRVGTNRPLLGVLDGPEAMDVSAAHGLLHRLAWIPRIEER